MFNNIYMRYLLLLIGVACTSGAAYFIRESSLHPIVLVSYRMIIAALILSPIFFYQWKKHPEFKLGDVFQGKGILIAVALPALIFAIENTFWNIGARNAPMANASMLVNLMPLAMPAVLWFMYRVVTTTREIIATIVALTGLVILVWSDINLSFAYAFGDAMCLIAMILLTVYLCLGRRFGHFPSIFLYVVPLYAVAGVLAAAAAGLWAVSTGGMRPDQYLPQDNYQWMMAAGLAIFPTVLGHSILNKSMQQLRGQAVALINMLHPLFAGVLGFFLFAEVPTMMFYIAAAFLATGAWIVASGREKTPDQELRKRSAQSTQEETTVEIDGQTVQARA